MILRSLNTAVLMLLAFLLLGCADHDHAHDHAHDDAHSDAHGDEHGHDHHGDEHRDSTIIDAASAREAGIRTAIVGGGPIMDSVNAMGSIRPAPGAQVLATARFPGVIRQVNVQVGDRVTRGDEVVIVDGNLSLAPYAITAAISGVVAEKMMDVGAAVDGDAVLRIIDPSRLVAELLLFGNELSAIKVGQQVVIQNVTDSVSAKGQITRIKPAVDPSTQSVAVEVGFSEGPPNWSPGSAVSGQIIVGDVQAALRVPRAAIQTFEGKTVVFTQQGDVYEARPVTLGRVDAEYAEVLSGLIGGEQIVVEQSFLIKADIGKSAAVHDH